MNSLQFVLTALLLVLPLVWISTDPRSMEDRLRAYLKIKSIFYFIAEIFIIGFSILSSKYFPLPFDKISILSTSGLLLYCTGLIIAVWAKLTMKLSWGLPGEHDIRRQNKIITTGPFKYSRNPIYLGLVLVITGYSIVLKSYTIFSVPIITYYFYKSILQEEILLTKYFKKDYLQYKTQVPRFL